MRNQTEGERKPTGSGGAGLTSFPGRDSFKMAFSIDKSATSFFSRDYPAVCDLTPCDVPVRSLLTGLGRLPHHELQWLATLFVSTLLPTIKDVARFKSDRSRIVSPVSTNVEFRTLKTAFSTFAR
jgi:hypothetical protein